MRKTKRNKITTSEEITHIDSGDIVGYVGREQKVENDFGDLE